MDLKNDENVVQFKMHPNTECRYFESSTSRIVVNAVNPYRTEGSHHDKISKRYTNKSNNISDILYTHCADTSKGLIQAIMADYEGDTDVSDNEQNTDNKKYPRNSKYTSQRSFNLSTRPFNIPRNTALSSRNVPKNDFRKRTRNKRYNYNNRRKHLSTSETFTMPAPPDTLQAEKTTYCRPVNNLFSEQFFYKTMQRNARLQNIVRQLVIERQKEKRKENWNNYINDLKNKHGYYNNSLPKSHQCELNDRNYPDFKSDYFNIRTGELHSEPIQTIINDFYEISNSLELDDYHTYPRNMVNQNRRKYYESNRLCYPTSSQGSLMMQNNGVVPEHLKKFFTHTPAMIGQYPRVMNNNSISSGTMYNDNAQIFYNKEKKINKQSRSLSVQTDVSQDLKGLGIVPEEDQKILPRRAIKHFKDNSSVMPAKKSSSIKESPKYKANKLSGTRQKENCCTCNLLQKIFNEVKLKQEEVYCECVQNVENDQVKTSKEKQTFQKKIMTSVMDLKEKLSSAKLLQNISNKGKLEEVNINKNNMQKPESDEMVLQRQNINNKVHNVRDIDCLCKRLRNADSDDSSLLQINCSCERLINTYIRRSKIECSCKHLTNKVRDVANVSDVDCTCKRLQHANRYQKKLNQVECSCSSSEDLDDEIVECSCNFTQHLDDNEVDCACKHLLNIVNEKVKCTCKHKHKDDDNTVDCACKHVKKAQNIKIECACTDIQIKDDDEVECACNKQKVGDIKTECACKRVQFVDNTEIECFCKRMMDNENDGVECACRLVENINTDKVECACKHEQNIGESKIECACKRAQFVDNNKVECVCADVLHIGNDDVDCACKLKQDIVDSKIECACKRSQNVENHVEECGCESSHKIDASAVECSCKDLRHLANDKAKCACRHVQKIDNNVAGVVEIECACKKLQNIAHKVVCKHLQNLDTKTIVMKSRAFNCVYEKLQNIHSNIESVKKSKCTSEQIRIVEDSDASLDAVVCVCENNIDSKEERKIEVISTSKPFTDLDSNLPNLEKRCCTCKHLQKEESRAERSLQDYNNDIGRLVKNEDTRSINLRPLQTVKINIQEPSQNITNDKSISSSIHNLRKSLDRNVLKSTAIDSVHEPRLYTSHVLKSTALSNVHEPLDFESKVVKAVQNTSSKPLQSIELKLDNLIASFNAFVTEMRATECYKRKIKTSSTSSVPEALESSPKPEMIAVQSDISRLQKTDQVLYTTMIRNTARNDAVSGHDSSLHRLHRTFSNTKIENIMQEEIEKSNKIKRDIKELLRTGCDRQCSVELSFDIPTKDVSTAVTTTSTKLPNYSEIEFDLEEINTPLRSVAAGSRMTIAVNTDPMGLLTLLRISAEAVKQLLSYMPQLNYYSYPWAVQAPRRRGIAHYVCNICGASFGRPSQLSDHIQHNYDLGRTRDCCICRHVIDMQKDSIRLFKCKFCGKRFTRAYCCELHQQSCAKLLGGKNYVEPNLMVLR